jgi:hypothetical protein
MASLSPKRKHIETEKAAFADLKMIRKKPKRGTKTGKPDGTWYKVTVFAWTLSIIMFCCLEALHYDP